MAHAVQARVMKLFRRGGSTAQPKETEGRQKLQKELYQFNQCVEHGFPAKPTALAHDPFLSLLAIGTNSGKLYIYGAPGVEFSEAHEGNAAVKQLFFVHQQGRLVTVLGDNSLHLWELNLREGLTKLERVKSLCLPTEQGEYKSLSCCALSWDGSRLLAGTESGDVYIVDVATFELLEQTIALDTVQQNVPDDFKLSPGAVKCIEQHRLEEQRYLIGYSHGLIALWDGEEQRVQQTYSASQQLESLSWHRDGSQFMSAHDDGSYVIWSVEDVSKPKEQATPPYGPFPCKPITKILWKSAKADPFIVFTGGMPRASYGDRHTVSIMQGTKHQVLELGSRVVDVCVLSAADDYRPQQPELQQRPEYDEPRWLLVLCDEELLLLDLLAEDWPERRAPLLACIHAAPLTCTAHVSAVPSTLWQQLEEAGRAQQPPAAWPLIGGRDERSAPSSNELLITGHEDGSVRFWNTSGICMRLLYTLNTAYLYGLQPPQQDAEQHEEWPPFKKVGVYDPYSDDPRLGIQRIALCVHSQTLVVAGAAGQLLVLKMAEQASTHALQCVPVNIVSERDSFVWKGHEPLVLTSEEVTHAAGFQPSMGVQISPPGAVSALTLNSEWQLLAVGTAHGFSLIDYLRKTVVHTFCTLKPSDGSGEEPVSRGKQIRKSLRQSFRRLRRGRQPRAAGSPNKQQQTPKVHVQEASGDEETPTEAAEEAAAQTAGAGSTPTEASVAVESTETAVEASPVSVEAAESSEAAAESAEAATSAAQEEAPAVEVEAPVEEAEPEVKVVVAPSSPEKNAASEPTPVAESPASVVRCVQFADTFLLTNTMHCPTLWVGTNAGHVYIYTVCVPANDKRESEDVSCKIAKEVQLRHGAPVLGVAILDRQARPLPDPFAATQDTSLSADYGGAHHAVLVSEQQIKVFELPKLKPVTKQKLCSAGGARITKFTFSSFVSRSDGNYSENCVICITTLGVVQVFRLPSLRLQIQGEAMPKDDLIAQSSVALSRRGEGFFLCSSSQLARFSLSALQVSVAQSIVEVSEEMRPAVIEQPEAEPRKDSDETVAAVTEAVADMDVSTISEDRPNLTAEITMDDIKVHAQVEDEAEGGDTSAAIPEEPAEEAAASGEGDGRKAPVAKAEESEASTDAITTAGETTLSAEEQQAAAAKLGTPEPSAQEQMIQ